MLLVWRDGQGCDALGAFDTGDVSLYFLAHAEQDNIVTAWIDDSIVIHKETVVGDVAFETKEELGVYLDVALLLLGLCVDHLDLVFWNGLNHD